MKKVSMSLLFILTALMTWAQSKTVTGTVKGTDGLTLPGAAVLEKGTSNGVVTDIDGKFSLKVAGEESILQISSLGLQTVELPVKGKSTFNLSMKDGAEKLKEVKITALGIKREDRALTYAVEEVKGDAVREANQTNFVNAIAGQVAGANVTQANGTAGGSSRVVLRGMTSLTGDNQALFVVDGVRINNSELNSELTTSGSAQSNRAIDLNPDDIESVSVLKGGAASALYGMDGANGVIVITTKKGANKKGLKGKPFTVDVSSSVSFSQVNKLPEIQEKYLQGAGGLLTGSTDSWGPLGDTMYWNGVPNQWDQNGDLVGQSDPTASKKFEAYDNLGTFFKTGVSRKHNVSISAGGDIASFRFSLGNLQDNGVIPNNTWGKTNVGMASSLRLLDNKLNMSGNVSYVRSGGNRIQQGSNLSGIGLTLFRSPINFDNANGVTDKPWDDESTYLLEDGTPRKTHFYDNPYWVVNKVPSTDLVNRMISSFNGSYEFSNLFTLGATVGSDIYTDRRKIVYAKNTATNLPGKIIENQYDVQQYDTYLNGTGGTRFGVDDKFGFNYTAGINWFTFQQNTLRSIGDNLAVDNFEHLSNAASIEGYRFLTKRKSFSYFATTDFSYNNFLYMTVTARQDYDSRFLVPGEEFKASNIDFFYPSISTGLVFSEFTKDNFKALSFGKLRASWAKTAKAPTTAYITSTTYTSATVGDGWSDGLNFPYNGQTSYSFGNVGGNAGILPETSSEIEVGLDLKFWGRRLELDVSYYDRVTKDAIVPVKVGPSTGFTNTYLNTGQLSTSGWDIALSGIPIQKENFSWSIRTVFSQYTSIVDKLADGLETLFVGGFGSMSVNHVVGEEFGQLYGGAWLRDEAGNLIINDDPSKGGATPIQAVKSEVVGNPNPDFILGITNTFQYKNLTFSFLWDIKVGGEMWNGTKGALASKGKSKETEGRDSETKVFEGNYGHLDVNGNIVHFDENNNEVAGPGAVNTEALPLDAAWYRGVGGGFGGPGEQYIEDASFTRLRNVRLAYSLPQSLLKDGGAITGVSFYVTGNNLLLFTKYSGIDPDASLTGSNSNAQGLDYFGMPNTKSITFGVNVKL